MSLDGRCVSVIAKSLPSGGRCSVEGVFWPVSWPRRPLLSSHSPCLCHLVRGWPRISATAASPLTSVRWARRVPVGVSVAAESQLRGALINTDGVVSGSAFSSLAALDGGPWAEEPWGLEEMPS